MYKKLAVMAIFASITFVWNENTNADSTLSECGYSDSPGAKPKTTSACTFSQRQGYISISIHGGKKYAFAPQGDQPGNYRDAAGDAVYRQRGLDQEGQLFKLPDNYLFVLWNPRSLDCDQQAMVNDGQCQLTYGEISFAVNASDDSSLNKLRIRPAGLAGDNSDLKAELDGTAYRAEVADLDGNGWPEVYVYVSSAGSGSYGSLVAYAVNNGQSASQIYLPPLDQSPEALEGYMGHDEFAVVENRLVRRFPLYKKSDTNAAASDGTRQLQYRLEPGEAGWILVVDRVVDY